MEGAATPWDGQQPGNLPGQLLGRSVKCGEELAMFFYSASTTLINECHSPWKMHVFSRRASRTRQDPSTASHFFWLRISTCCSCVAFPVSCKYSLPKILFLVLRLHRKEIKVRDFSLKFILLRLCNQLASAGVITVDNSRSRGMQDEGRSHR